MLLFQKHIFLFLCCLVISYGAIAQEKYRIVHWGADDGLSMGSKNYMLKDAKGFLWVSSVSGINRFDGKTFKNYFIGFADYPLIEDSLHNIWVGTNNGISRYDIKADTFTNFKSYPDSNFVE